MKKAGYVFSLIGGLLALIFSMLLAISGPALFAGKDIYNFAQNNSSVDVMEMWTAFGEYHDIDPLIEAELGDYIDDYQKELKKTSENDLYDIAKDTGLGGFKEIANIYRDIGEYAPKLKIGMIACLAASVIALIGAQVAMRWHVAGGVMVLFGAASSLVFSLIASSIIPMAGASLLMIVGGVLMVLCKKRGRRQEVFEGAKEEAAV